MQAVGALLELARGLRAAEHEHAEDGDLVVREPERLLHELPVLDAAAALPRREPRPLLPPEALQRLADRLLVVVDDGVAVRRLVAGEPQRVQRQRVGVGRRSLLLDQAAEHPDLDGVRVHEPKSNALPRPTCGHTEGMQRDPDQNVVGGELLPCSVEPVTGFFRDGCCATGPEDVGSHTVCARMTAEFLEFSKLAGNDLSTPRPEWGFAGLQPGDRWCVCAARWLEAYRAGVAAPVILGATHERALEVVPIEALMAHVAAP